jgi:signal peptidase I
MENTSNGGNILRDWIFPLIAAVIIAIVVNRTLFFLVEVPSGSMFPTIKEGDRLLVTKIYNPQKLNRGDIVVFKSKELNMTLVKRLIALPGDTVDIEDDGTLIINGEKKDEPYVIQKGLKSGHFEIPKNCYFFLGDNRRDSSDARYWKMPYIQGSDIIAKAQFRVYPFDRVGLIK